MSKTVAARSLPRRGSEAGTGSRRGRTADGGGPPVRGTAEPASAPGCPTARQVPIARRATSSGLPGRRTSAAPPPPPSTFPSARVPPALAPPARHLNAHPAQEDGEDLEPIFGLAQISSGEVQVGHSLKPSPGLKSGVGSQDQALPIHTLPAPSSSNRRRRLSSMLWRQPSRSTRIFPSSRKSRKRMLSCLASAGGLEDRRQPRVNPLRPKVARHGLEGSLDRAEISDGRLMRPVGKPSATTRTSTSKRGCGEPRETLLQDLLLPESWALSRRLRPGCKRRAGRLLHGRPRRPDEFGLYDW